MEKFGRKRFSILLVSCIMIMLLVFYALVDFTFAWLFTSVEKDNTGVTNMAKIESSHSATSEIEVTMPQANYSMSLSDKVKITNTGSTDALLRVFYTIYIDENINQIATTSAISELIIDSSFVASDENIQNVYSGYYYYNSYLSPNESVNFLTSVVPTSEIANKPVKIKAMYELVNYTGGAFQLGQDLPWNNIPASWAFNYDYVTKSSESTITPRLDIKFSEISKIQITARTTSVNENMLFCRWNGAYIGIHGSGWVFSQLTATASMSPLQFTDGNFNTVVFDIHTCSDVDANYVSLVWDSAWSKEISYKQIKIWDKDGELRYDLVPHVYNTSEAYFRDRVTGKTLTNMYLINGSDLTSTTNAYSGFLSQILKRDYETYSDGYSVPSSDGAMAVVVTNEARSGNKCVKVTNTKNKEDVTSSNFASYGMYDFQVKAGYRYTISMWVKSDAPSNAMSYCIRNGVIYGSLPGIRILGNRENSFNIFVNYCPSDEWTLISITTPEIVDKEHISFNFYIPTGIEYTTYIDDLVVRAHI